MGKQRGYDPSKQMGECYCAGGCFKTYNDKRAEMKCPKKQGLGAPLGGSCDPAGYVASIGTDGGDKGKCLEIKFGGGKLQSAFCSRKAGGMIPSGRERNGMTASATSPSLTTQQ